MKLTLEINLDNDAYLVDYINEINENVANMLMKIKWGDDNGIIHDSNGNKSGFWNIDEEIEL
jgi:hypothetical protein